MERTSHRAGAGSRGLRAAAFALALGSIAAAPAAGQGLTYTFSPGGRWIEWDDALGFDRTRLLGGELNLGFGRYVGLSGYYHSTDRVQTGLGRTELSLPGGGVFDEQMLDMEQYGGVVTLALGSGSIVPVLSGGGGLLRFQPEDGDESTQLTLDAGGGLRLHLGESLTGEVMVERSSFRMDRYRLARGFSAAALAPPTDPASDQIWNNLTLRAGIGLQLGRRRMESASELDDAFSQRYQAPFASFALAVEPLVGRMQFGDATGLGDQDMVGLRAGMDFGSFFGLRGFYWQGTESDFRSTVGMKVVGGEAQFALAAGPGLNPYLTAGAGRMSWEEDFREDPAAIPADQTSLILGGGLDFNFGPRIRATFAARDFILAGSDVTAASSLDGVSSPGDLAHNWQFSAGLKFVLGGGGVRSDRPSGDRPVPMPAVIRPETAEAVRTPREDATSSAGTPMPAVPAASVATEDRGLPEPTAQATATHPAPTAASPTEPVARVAAPAPTITLPVPERGEIYIRFGESGGMRSIAGDAAVVSPPLPQAVATSTAQTQAGPSAAPSSQFTPPAAMGAPGPSAEGVPTGVSDDALRKIIREELEAARPAPVTESPQAIEMRAFMKAMEDRLRAMEARERRLETTVAGAVEGSAPDIVVVGTSSEAESRPALRRRVHELRPYSGFSMDAQTQMLVGVAADIGPLDRSATLRLVPSGAFGFGQGRPTAFLSLGLEYRMPFTFDPAGIAIQPYASAGPALFKREKYEGALSLQLGALARLGAEGTSVFAAYQGVDFFEGGRLLIGVRQSR